MRNHDEKIKDMAESVLPSTARRSAREHRRRAHRRQRARQRDLLIAIRRGDYDYDYEGDYDVEAGAACDADFDERRRAADINDMMWHRRFADKTGSLTRWAARRVDRDDDLRDASVDEQRDHFARLLPDNLIGRHAVQHIESALEYRTRSGSWRDQAAVRADRVRRERAQLTADLGAILASGRHRELNEALRAGYLWEARGDRRDARPAAPPAACRLLLGAHDVDDFVAGLAGRHPWIPDLARRLANPKRVS